MESPQVERGAQTLIGDDIAYMLPMGIFLALTYVGATWPATYEASYVVKTIFTAIVLGLCWKQYTPIIWKHLPLAAAVGVVALIVWIGVEKLVPNYPRLSHDAFNPQKEIANPAWRWSFIVFRWAGATLVVPVMEELFWRDFLWRSIIAPNDFKLARIGEWDWKAFLIVALVCAGVHPQWLTAIIWSLGIGLFLVYTRSLGACIVCHAVTNFLLGAYVLYTHDWIFW
jgi:uncharacterized protein